MMFRTQISLDPVEHRRAKRRAAELGISLAEYIRRLVREDLAGPAAGGEVAALFALGDSGGSDVAAHQDEYVGAALDHEHRLSTTPGALEPINHRLGRAAAERFWDAVRAGAADLEPVATADIEAAWRIGRDFPDQGFSIVDRTSFAVMERLGISQAATFDQHFAVYRYGKRLDRAFELLR